MTTTTNLQSRACTRLVNPNSGGLSERIGGASWKRFNFGCLIATLGFSTFSVVAADPGARANRAGDFLIRLAVLGIFPEDNSSSIEAVGGKVDISSRIAPELTASYFLTDHFAAQLIATMTRPSIRAKGTALGDVKVGAVTVLPPTLTGQYYFSPLGAFSPYIGAGATVFITFDSDPARGSGVTDLSTDSHIAPAVQAGFNYSFANRWYFNFEVDQIFVKTHALVTVLDTTTVKAKDNIDPFLVGAGIGYRF